MFEETVKLSPVDTYQTMVSLPDRKEEELEISVYADGRCLVQYQPEAYEIPKLPEPAKAAKEPETIQTCEELYLTGQHIEQYRHATYLPDPYYLEGLKRDGGDIRLNNAYGLLLMRRGQFSKAEKYFRKALERLVERNPNPYHSESYYLLGLTLFYQNRNQDAYDVFYKAVRSNEQQEMSYYYLAAIDAAAGRFSMAYAHVERALVKNAHNIKARGLKAYLLRKLGKTMEAAAWVDENLTLDPFDFVSGNEKIILEENDQGLRDELNVRMRNFHENYLMAARDYAEMGACEEAITLLKECTEQYPMLYYYQAYYQNQLRLCEGKTEETLLANEVKGLLEKAESCLTDYCFPNKLEDIIVLRFAVKNECRARAGYYLGCLFYDKLQLGGSFGSLGSIRSG